MSTGSGSCYYGVQKVVTTQISFLALLMKLLGVAITVKTKETMQIKRAIFSIIENKLQHPIEEDFINPQPAYRQLKTTTFLFRGHDYSK